jgi:hypothetical protein
MLLFASLRRAMPVRDGLHQGLTSFGNVIYDDRTVTGFLDASTHTLLRRYSTIYHQALLE